MAIKALRKTKRAKRVRRHSDPWAFRENAVVEQASGIDGRRLDICTYRRGNRVINAPRFEFFQPPGADCARSMLPELRRRVAAEISKYRTSGECSAFDIALVEALWRDGKTLRAYARERNVTPAAIGDHIERLRHRCPRFYLYWLWKNRRRRQIWR